MLGRSPTIAIPNLVPYQKLISHLNSLDIGTVMDVNPTFTTKIGSKAVIGRCRDVKTYIPKLAQFYLTVNTVESATQSPSCSSLRLGVMVL